MILVAIFFGGQVQPGSVGAFPSSYSRTPSGLLAAYRLLVRQGRPAPERCDTPWTSLKGTGHLLIIAEPLQVRPSDEEVDALLHWVRDGNTLLYLVALDDAVSRTSGNNPGLDRRLGLLRKAPRSPSTMADFVSGVQSISATAQLSRAATASPGTLGIRTIATLATESLPMSVKGLPLLEDLKGGAHLVWRTEEQGAIFVGSSPSMFSNELIGGDDNLPLLVNLLDQVRGGNILFDEYHHGYYEAPPLTTPYARRVMAALGVQLLLVGGVFLVSRSRRFGPLKGRPRVLRRRSLEFVDALAELYRRGRAGGHAAARLYEDFREEMCRELRLPHGATVEQLAGAMARRTGRNGAAIARALRDAEQAAANERTSPRRLLAVARVLTELKKEVIAS